MKKLLFIMIACTFIFSNIGAGIYTEEVNEIASKNPFIDVEEDYYYYEPVLWAVENDITDGVSPTNFAPESICTRGQVVTFLWRANGCQEPSVSENLFSDVRSSDYYYDAILWAVEEKITDGYTATTFAPNRACTRGEVVTFLWRAAGKPQSTMAENPFVDITEGTYYYDAVLWAVEMGITDGWTNELFVPDMICTRGQIVTFLYRAFLVDAGMKVDSIRVFPETISVKEGFSVPLSAEINGEGVKNQAVNWGSSDENIASVDKNGLVIAKSEGTVTITACAKGNKNVYETSVIEISNNTDFEYTANSNRVVLSGYLSNNSTMFIPEFLDGKVVDKIGNDAFRGNSVITDIVFSENLKTISYQAFSNCDGLTEVEIPDTVEGDFEGCFKGCSNLQKIRIGSGITWISSYSFYGMENLKEVELSEGLESIGSDAFYGTGISEIHIPSTVKTISYQAFAECDGLTEVEIPDTVEGDFESCFKGCSNLQKIRIGSGITWISSYSFYGMENLKEVELSEGLESIGSDAFYGTGIGEIHIPSTVKTISYQAFAECDGLTEVEIPDTVEGDFESCFKGCSNLQKIRIGSGITWISSYSFYGMENLKEVELSEGLESIGNDAFYGTGIGEIHIPSTVKTISYDAFANCKNLMKCYLYGEEVTLGTNALPNNEGAVVYYNANGENWKEVIQTYDKMIWIPFD